MLSCSFWMPNGCFWSFLTLWLINRWNVGFYRLGDGLTFIFKVNLPVYSNTNTMFAGKCSYHSWERKGRESEQCAYSLLHYIPLSTLQSCTAVLLTIPSWHKNIAILILEGLVVWASIWLIGYCANYIYLKKCFWSNFKAVSGNLEKFLATAIIILVST